MPQLNPTPWLFMLILSWVMLLTIFLTKITYMSFLNNPVPPMETSHKTTWPWPWT